MKHFQIRILYSTISQLIANYIQWLPVIIKKDAFWHPFRDPARIQTWNLLIRSQILYSVELRGHHNLWWQKYKKIHRKHPFRKRVQYFCVNIFKINIIIKDFILYHDNLFFITFALLIFIFKNINYYGNKNQITKTW